MDLASRIRTIADQHLGEPAQEVIERHYADVIDGIESGNGPEAIRSLVRALDAVAGESAGEESQENFRSDIAEAIKTFELND